MVLPLFLAAGLDSFTQRGCTGYTSTEGAGGSDPVLLRRGKTLYLKNECALRLSAGTH